LTSSPALPMNRLPPSILAFVLAFGLVSHSAAQSTPDGSASQPLRVILIPADGGTEDGTKADFVPLFNAVTRSTGLHFDIRVGQSYGAVIEAMSNHLADVAFLGPVSYVQARRRNAAELLAVAVENGESVYYAGIFVAADSEIAGIEDLRGRSAAFGDVNSASSFTFQVAMLLDAGMDPARDLGRIFMTGSHANSVKALAEGHVEAACLSFESYEKAVREGAVDPSKIKVLAKSEPIPYPPLALHPATPEAMKARLKDAFHHVHQAEGVTPDMVRGYGGKRVDRFDSTFSEEEFAAAAGKLALVTDEIKGEMLKRAAER